MLQRYEQMLRAFQLTNIVFETVEKITVVFSGDTKVSEMHKLHKQMLMELETKEPDDLEIFRLLDEMELLARQNKL